MKKVDIEKLRASLKASGRQQVAFSFPGGIDLATAAQAAQAAGSEYIEIEGWASTLEKNDQGFQIAASTWQKDSAFARLKKNPMVLFNHKLDFPIGQVIFWEGRPEGLWTKLRIRYNAVIPTQEKVGAVISDGTLKALSIRLDICEFEVIETDKGIEIIVTDCVLSEVSLCSVQSDPGAVTDENLIATLSSVYQAASIPDEITKEDSTMWKLLAKQFGMDPEKVTEEQVTAEWQRRQTLGASAITGLGLDPNKVTADELTAALTKLDPAKMAELSKTNSKLAAQLAVAQAIGQNKIAENDEDTKTFALSLAETSPEQFAGWLKLQKVIAPDTRTITGEGKTLGGKTNEGGSPYITKEDTEICLKFGHFKKTELAKMDELAETAPNEAASWVLGTGIAATAEDQKIVAHRRKWDAACGVPARD